MSTLHRYADYLPEPIADQFPSPVRNRERIRPLTAGQFFPDFYLEEDNVINSGPLLQTATGGTSLHLLTAQPLVVAFYSVNWNGYGDRLMAELIEKHAAIEAAGARLLVLSSEGKKHFTEFNRQPLPFDVVRDAQHRIARKAGIYRESDPIWGRVAGVNADVPVPAVYLITPSLEITYSFADTWLQDSFSVDALLAVVDKQLAISA
ncbi:redoxin domain-containing protein [Chitinophaga qingshengii]|uniref:Redoxin domain-containing protein n=1 Tax=Chitinophaga qingshengii TaxID=1569794 RepID=A0ABR7TNT5_9BACT|nr:redoxin domain-containing protein [Chitinophaga qingshengii]MBC9931228.1 redoxin domain-containing protein [Chitinophaga qingshengii]